MSWTTEISSWKSFSVRYDGAQINRAAIEKVYTLVALLSQAEWSALENGDGVQFHRCGVVFIADDYYQQEPHFERFLRAAIGTVITASVADDNTSKLGLLTATKLEDGWLLAFTIHPDNDGALSGFDYPRMKRRAHCIKYHLDCLRDRGDFLYQRVDQILEAAISNLENLSKPSTKRKLLKRVKKARSQYSDPRIRFRGENFSPIHKREVIIPKAERILGQEVSLKEDHSLPSFDSDFPRSICPKWR